MCDTLWAPGAGGTFFAKNSDRPDGELQLIEALPPRPPGRTLRTQHLEIPDRGAQAVLGSRPRWMWGLEHGVNEHGVAVGNEKLWTAEDPRSAPDALTGMELVRLCLEGATSASHGVDLLSQLIEAHGQGGVCDESGDRYFSSFLVADSEESWVVETMGRQWVATPSRTATAISNRFTLGTDWTTGSAGVPPGTDVSARWSHPSVPTGHADRRLAASRRAVTAGPQLADLARHLRDHGDGAGAASPPPTTFNSDGEGVTVCMHLPGYMHTAAAMIAYLPAGGRPRAWVAPGSPCVSVFLPALVPDQLPGGLGDPALHQRMAALRQLVETAPEHLPNVRAQLDPLEATLWQEAEAAADDVNAWEAMCRSAADRLVETLDDLGA